MTPQCAVCAKPLADGAYACSRCAARTRGHLLGITELIGDARAVAYGLDSSGGGMGAGVPGSRVLLDLHAAAKLDAVGNQLGTWVRHVAEERGLYPPPTPPGFDVIGPSARWLVEQLEWFRHRPEGVEALEDVAACNRVVRGVVDGPAEKRYLGPCGADVVRAEMVGDQWESQVVACEGDVYGRDGAEHGTCRACGAKVDQGKRRAWLDGEVRQYAYTAKEISDAYPVKAPTIRQWASRGLLAAHGANRDGHPYYLLGDVLDLASGDAVRREEARARRAERMNA